MYACPACEYSVQDFELRCPACASDLEILARLHELPDARLNRALDAARKGDATTAAVLLGAVLAERLDDVDAWLAWGLVNARRGAWAAARECFSMVLVLRPNDTAATRALQTIDQLADPATPEDQP